MPVYDSVLLNGRACNDCGNEMLMMIVMLYYIEQTIEIMHYKKFRWFLSIVLYIPHLFFLKFRPDDRDNGLSTVVPAVLL